MFQKSQAVLTQRIEAAFQEALKKMNFQSKHLTQAWVEKAQYALLFASPLKLGVSIGDYNRLYTLTADSVDFLQFAILSNNMEARNPYELSIDMADYTALITAAQSMAEEWNAQTSELRKQIEEQEIANFEAEAKSKTPGAPGLKAIKAEA
jgi:hypothetical protein